MAVTDNIKRVRAGDTDEAGICTDVYVITNPAWNKRLAELDEFVDEHGVSKFYDRFDSFVKYMEDELERDALRHGDHHCDVSDPKQGHKSDRYYFEVIWF